MKKIIVMAFLLLAAVSATAGPKKASSIFNKEHLNVSVHGRYQHVNLKNLCEYQNLMQSLEISARLVTFTMQNKYIGAQSYCVAKNISINL